MATAANLPPGAMPVDEVKNGSDPFFAAPTTDAQRQRYSTYADQLSLYSNGTPSQAKRALEAHLSETERRLQEASQLGTLLVQQRKELAERLRDVDGQQQQDEITPDLKSKLVELEREVNEVSRETARAFVAKNRVASGETSESAVLSSDAQHSPSKVHAPSRKQRNQAPSRVNDLKLATDISTSLLAQVRDLQAAVAEKDDSLRLVSSEKDQLDLECSALQKMVQKAEAEAESTKNSQWDLETQLHELKAAHTSVTDREQRLTYNLNTTQTEKASLERELEDLKHAHGQLTEDHVAARKHHEAELGSLKRNANLDENERDTLQKKVEELTAQNKELAQHVAYRLGAGSRAASGESAFDEPHIPEDGDTPDNSPPGSPSKATPRHGPLHAETLQSSLNHAYRTIQNYKNQVHREKTEKNEYRRLWLDAKDRAEAAERNGVDSGKKRKAGKDQDLFKKPIRPDRLGAPREGTDEIIVDDPEWEDHDGQDNTPSKSRTVPTASSANTHPIIDHSTDAYVTATEHSDAFETANELVTETDAFQTTAETLDGNSSDELTEKEEGPASTNTTVQKRPSATNRYSFQSTASTSGDDDDDYDIRTPVQVQHPKYKLRLKGAGANRTASGRVVSDSRGHLQDSPASVNSNSSTPAAASKSLFAELEGLSDAETEEGTPRSVNMLSPAVSPELVLKRSPAPSRLRTSETIEPKPVMVDTGIMTEPWEPEHKSVLSNASDMIGAALAGGIGFGLGRHSNTSPKPESKEGTPEMEAVNEKSVEAAKVPAVSEPVAPVVEAPKLTVSSTVSQHTEPVDPVVIPAVAPQLQASSIISQHVEPVETPKQAAVPLGHSAIVSQHTEPREHIPVVAPVLTKESAPALSISTILEQHTEPEEHAPVVAPTSTQESAPALSFSTIMEQHTEPEEHVPVVVPVSIQESAHPLTFSTILLQETEPVDPPRPATAVNVNAGEISSSSVPSHESTAETSNQGTGIFDSILPQKKTVSSTSIAEDETSQPPRASIKEDAVLPAAILAGAAIGTASLESRRPFRQIDGNAPPSPERKAAKASSNVPPKPLTIDTSNEGTQTTLSASEIDRLMKGKAPLLVDPAHGRSTAAPTGAALAGIPPRRSQSRDSVNTVERVPRRPGSSGSMRSRTSTPPPPLPMDARQVVAAAAQKQPGTVAAPQFGNMGPPTMPASAYNRSGQAYRPRTPTNALPSPTMRDRNVRHSVSSTPGGRSGAISPATTRRSSVSSFASELDHRFNITRSQSDGRGFEAGAGQNDPRMIQAITQTMIGEYLHKYTRKAGREEMSSSRHRRFFWVHPYTRTLYWSDQDPATAGRNQLKAKSVAIEAVRVVTDDNPMPPGLHRKSLVVITPGRAIKFTASTSQRHETWFNALSYLLLRNAAGEEEEGGVTAEDVDEFNPGFFRGSSRLTRGSRASIQSYMSRTTQRTVSPQRQQTLTQRPSSQRASSLRSESAQPSGSGSGRLSALSGVFKGASVSSRHSRQNMNAAVFENSEAADSIEELRKTIEESERQDRLENVRACCDGKFWFLSYAVVVSPAMLFNGTMTNSCYRQA
jgi:hypothetical protein